MDSNYVVITVAVAALDIEDSTAPPPAVGADTTWLLSFHSSNAADAGPFPGRPTWIPELKALRSGGITAYVTDPSLAMYDNNTPITGAFTGTMLGGVTPDGLPTTTGSILGLHIRSQVHRELRPHVWAPLPGPATLRRVSASPKWFRRNDMITGTDVNMDTGLMVEMAVLSVGDQENDM